MSQFRVKPRVRETSLITGSGTYTLLGAVTGFQAFLGGGVSAGDLVPYYVTDGTNWEEGIGTVGSGPATLARTHVHKSSIADAAISWGSNTTVECRIGWVSELTTPRVKSVSIAGGAGTQVLTQDEQRCSILVLTGVLTGARTIEVDATPWVWKVYNNTSGNFAVTLKVNGQTGVVLTQGKRRVLHNDGTDVRDSYTDFIDPALPLMFIAGLTYANAAGDPTNDITIAAGVARSSDNAANLSLAAAITKQLDAAWAVGTNAGGLDTGSIGNSDYYIWLIKRSDSGVVDVLFSLSSTAPTMPANYDYKRLIGWFKRVGATIVAFTTYETEGGGLEHLWTTPSIDVSLANTLTTARRTDAVKVPLNFSVSALLNIGVSDASSAFNVYIYSPDQSDQAPSTTVTPLNTLQIGAPASGFRPQVYFRTSPTGTVAARADLATVDSYAIVTLGFRWARRN